ncbi:unnamed protein product [Rotaria sp. Silwood1]|nr:unnamed protein product [Rotaria sp. Silwood1]
MLHSCFYLFARKKLFLWIFYFIGTILFVSFSYKTANQLYQTSLITESSFSTRLLNIHQTTNISLQSVSFGYEDQNQCFNNSKSLDHTLSNITRQNKIINYLGFVLRSHSLFYCSVPKVATRTLLRFITYLHIRDDLIPLLKNHSIFNSSVNFTNHLNIFNVADFNQVLLSSTRNNTQPSTHNAISILESLLSRLMVFNNTRSKTVDLWSMYQRESFPLTRLRTLSDPSILFSSNFTRVIFVRHPFERLASAYVDKIVTLKNETFSLYDNLRRAICRKYSLFYLKKAKRSLYLIHKRISNNIKEPCQKIIPKFEHFIRYIMSDSLHNDVHWQSYSKLCHGVSLHDIDIATTATTNDILKLVRGDSNIKLIYICAKHFGTLTLVDTIARACEITY